MTKTWLVTIEHYGTGRFMEFEVEADLDADVNDVYTEVWNNTNIDIQEA